MSNISEESDSAFEHFYSEGYDEWEDLISEQEREDWVNRIFYGVEW